MRMRSFSIAFTLIELLIVMVIIAVLAGLLLSAVALTRKKARKSQCMSNLRQIGIGIAMYTGDYQQYPIATNMPSLKLNDLLSINGALSQYRYVNGDVFHCEMDTEYYEREESSYEWSTHLNGRKTTRRLDKPRQMLWDYEPFHGKDAGGEIRNILYTDGRATGL
jgi:prepilin-type N-terminal cleavage/methylation domain-containing protein